jgi:hypothetical protein
VRTLFCFHRFWTSDRSSTQRLDALRHMEDHQQSRGELTSANTSSTSWNLPLQSWKKTIPVRSRVPKNTQTASTEMTEDVAHTRHHKQVRLLFFLCSKSLPGKLQRNHCAVVDMVFSSEKLVIDNSQDTNRMIRSITLCQHDEKQDLLSYLPTSYFGRTPRYNY